MMMGVSKYSASSIYVFIRVFHLVGAFFFSTMNWGSQGLHLIDTCKPSAIWTPFNPFTFLLGYWMSALIDIATSWQSERKI
jgi:hypothetical protein